MHIGDVWEYEVELIPPETYQVRITGDTLMPNGNTYFVFEATGYFNYSEYLRMDDSLRVFQYRGLGFPDSCNSENIVYDLTLADSTLFIECINEYPAGNFPALISTFSWNYVTLGMTASTKEFWGVYIDSTINDTLLGSIFYTENWLAEGIGRTFSQPEAGSPERILGAIIDSVQYGYVTSIKPDNSTQTPPNSVVLYPNYPNPFNSSTKIEFEIPTKMNLQLTIYDLLGKEIKQLFRGFKNPGRHSFIWDGRDNLGNQVASGVYYYKLEFDNFAEIKTLLLIK